MTTTVLEQPVLMLDHRGLYPGSEEYVRQVRNLAADAYPHVVSPDALDGVIGDLVVRAIQPGSLVLLQLMAASMTIPHVRERCRETASTLILLPASRHPYVTLSFDDDALLDQTLGWYGRRGRALMAELPDRVRAWKRAGGTDVVLFDSSSSTGRDCVLIEHLLATWLGEPTSARFTVVIDETTGDDAHGPGLRGGPKARSPDLRGIRLIDHNVRYMSHLALLQLDEEGRFSRSRILQERFPDMLTFWDQVPVDLRWIHGYDHSRDRVHRERLHLRSSRWENEQEILARISASWDGTALRSALGAEHATLEDRVAFYGNLVPEPGA